MLQKFRNSFGSKYGRMVKRMSVAMNKDAVSSWFKTRKLDTYVGPPTLFLAELQSFVWKCSMNS